MSYYNPLDYSPSPSPNYDRIKELEREIKRLQEELRRHQDHYHRPDWIRPNKPRWNPPIIYN